MKLKGKYLIATMINILLLKNLMEADIAARLKQANLASKYDIADFAKKHILMINYNILKKSYNSNKMRHKS